MEAKGSRKIRKIRDVIHDYVPITSLEEKLINTKEFQRLRYISQNSLAYYTFPSNTTNRFSHSLGVMHIGGTLFCKALENSNSETLTSFLEESKRLIEKCCSRYDYSFSDLKDNWIDQFGNISGFNHLPANLSKPEWLDEEGIMCLNVMWQAVRIACVIHDIGHFPFSHLFEHALEKYVVNEDSEFATEIKSNIDQWKSDYSEYLTEFTSLLNPKSESTPTQNETPKLHEINGVLLLRGFKPRLVNEENSSENSYLLNICLMLGKTIFIHNRTEYKPTDRDRTYSVLDSMHTIVSSEIDADRLDYCMRDPYASGIDLGAYDLRRITDSIMLEKMDTSSGPSFEIVFGIGGIPAIESFFHQRFLMYEYLIFHHNVARLDAVLEHVMGLLFKLYDLKFEMVTGIIEDFGLISFEDGKIKLLKKLQFYNYDDYWLKTLLNRVYSTIIEGKPNEGRMRSILNGIEATGTLYELYLCLEIVLFRNNNHIISMWKRFDNVEASLERLLKVLQDKGHNIERNELVRSLNKVIGTDSSAKLCVQRIRRTLGEQGRFLIIKPVSKKIFDDKPEKQAMISCELGRKAAHEVSPYLDSLRHCEANVIKFNLFIVGQNIRGNKESERKSKEDLLGHIIDFIIN